MLDPVLVTPPSRLPVSLAEAKAHLRVDHDDENALIESAIAAATDHLDGWRGILGRCLVTQTWRVAMAGWPCGGKVRLPIGTAQPSVAPVVKYYDAANVLQTVNALHVLGPYRIKSADYVYFASAFDAPAVYDRPDAVQIDYAAGFGAPQDVPMALRHAILLLAADLYTTREAKVDARMVDNPALRRLIDPYRLMVM